MPFQVQPTVQVNPSTPTQQPLQHHVPSTPQTLVQFTIPMIIQNPGLSSPQTPILGVSQVIVPLISQVTVQPLVQSLPQVYGVQSIPTISSMPQIPVVKPNVLYMQVSFQGQPF